MITKGEWKVEDNYVYCLNNKGTNRFFAGVQHGNTDTGEMTPHSELVANANLIAAAVNACILLNPDNPLAAAESIKDMREARAMYDALKLIVRALAKAEGREE